MAKKEKTIEDIYKADMKYLIKDLNQKIKLLGTMAYISHSGEIFVKDNDRQLERYCRFYNKDYLPACLNGVIFDTIQVFDMCKNLKISLMKVLLLEDCTIISQEGLDMELRINQLKSENLDSERNMIKDTIFPEFYKKLPSIIDPYEDNYSWAYISDKQMEALEEGELVKVDYNLNGKDIHAYITKQIFPLIKKSTEIAYTVLNIINPLDNKYFYVLYRERIEENGLYVYTLTATYQSI